MMAEGEAPKDTQLIAGLLAGRIKGPNKALNKWLQLPVLAFFRLGFLIFWPEM